jgi:hypothetical protein
MRAGEKPEGFFNGHVTDAVSARDWPVAAQPHVRLGGPWPVNNFLSALQ